jgi:hypothetical protein
MNLEEAKALIARVDAAEKAGVEFTDEVMQSSGMFRMKAVCGSFLSRLRSLVSLWRNTT